MHPKFYGSRAASLRSKWVTRDSRCLAQWHENGVMEKENQGNLHSRGVARHHGTRGGELLVMASPPFVIILNNVFKCQT